MRLPHGILKKISEETGLSKQYLSDLAATRSRAGRNRSVELEEACGRLGINVSKELWLFGTSQEIKSALSKSALP